LHRRRKSISNNNSTPSERCSWWWCPTHLINFFFASIRFFSFLVGNSDFVSWVVRDDFFPEQKASIF
jgi:hypothetical protein